jgi:hypothetical protein
MTSLQLPRFRPSWAIRACLKAPGPVVPVHLNVNAIGEVQRALAAEARSASSGSFGQVLDLASGEVPALRCCKNPPTDVDGKFRRGREFHRYP